MVNFDDMLSTLSYFGLEGTDSKVYVGLLQLGATTIGSMSSKLNIDRGKAYRSINKLRSLGVVITTLANPTTIKAVKPDEALTTIIQRKEDEITTMEKLARRLVPELEQVQHHPTPMDDSIFSIIQGRMNIYSRIGKLILTSSKTVYFVTTIDDVIRMYHTAIPEKIKSCIQNGGEVRLITDKVDDNQSSFIYKLGIKNSRVGTLPSRSRLIVEKEKHLIMSGSVNNSIDMNDQSDSILYTNSTEMINNMYSLCTYLWQKSKPLKPILTQ